MPRERQTSFEPQLIQKHQTRVDGFEDKILALYARGMTTRDIQAQVQDLYGVEISPTFVSNITEAVMEEVRQWQNRPLDAIYFIACMDGLTGLPEAVETLYPQTRVHLCMVHMVRPSLTYVSYKHRKEGAADVKLSYGAATEAEAEVYLDLFAEKWDRLSPSISTLWRTHWSRVIPLFAFPEDIRKGISTTNATPSLTMSLRKVTRNHRIFPSDEAAFQVISLAIQNIAKKWTMPIRNWTPALTCFAIEFGERFPQYIKTQTQNT